jgi:hypothetical protein
MARDGFKRINAEIPEQDHRLLAEYCAAGIGINPTEVVRSLITEFVQLAIRARLEPTTETARRVIPIAVRNVAHRLEPEAHILETLNG